MSPFDIPELLHHILSFLPGLSLSRCAQVNSQWRLVAQRLNRRSRAAALLSRAETPAEALAEIQAQIQNEIRFIPDMALVFVTKFNLLLPSIIEQLPRRTQVLGCTGRGIIATQANGDPVEIESGPSISILLLRLPETHVAAFPVADADLRRCRTSIDRQRYWQQLVKLPPGTREPVHAILLSQGDPSPFDGLASCYDAGIKVGGITSSFSRTRRAFLTREGVFEEGNAVLAFSGGNIRVRARVIGDKKVEASLALLAAPPPGERYLAGFLFSCIGRGSQYHGKLGVEAAVFKKLFPGVPLAGFFTGGELGPEVLEPLDLGPGEHTGVAQFGYTSVFCLISSSS